MMNKVLLLVFVTIFCSPAFSQIYGEVGLFAGSSFFRGDVHSSLQENTHIAFGVNYRQNFNARWALNFKLRQAKVTGNDANSDITFEQHRNLSFQSNITDLAVVMEFNFLEFKPYSPQSFFQNADVFTPHLFLGISLFRFNPKAYLSGNLYDLAPLQTEGVSYSKVSVAFPIGFGFKFRLSDRLLLDVTAEYRITATDYLDDVSTRYPSNPDVLSKTTRDLSNKTIRSQGSGGSSWGTQRGNDLNNDWFSYVGLTLSYNLQKNPSSCHFNTSK